MTHIDQNRNTALPEIGFVRIPQILSVFPVCKNTWLAMVKEGKAPQPVKIGKRMIAWRVEEIREFLAVQVGA